MQHDLWHKLRARERLTPQFPVLLCEVNVRPRNDVSLAFHESVGFREVGCIWRYLSDYLALALL